MKNIPQQLTSEELKEIFILPEVHQAWGYELPKVKNNEDEYDEGKIYDFENMLSEWEERIYAVKFNFVSETMPGYVGDLFVVFGNLIEEPIILGRNKETKTLFVVER